MKKLTELILTNFKNLVIGSLLLCLAVFGYKEYQSRKENDRLHQELVGTTSKYEQLSKSTALLSSEYVELKTIKEKQEKRFAEVLIRQNERIKMLSDATFLISKHYQKTQGPDYFFETPKKTQNYVYNEIRVDGPDSPPIGFVMIKSDGRTYKGTYGFEIRVDTLQTVDETTGKIKVYSKAFLTAKDNGLAGKRRKDFKEWKGLDYPLNIVGGTALIDPTVARTDPKKFQWFVPRLNLGVATLAGVEGFNFKPELNVSLSGYGRSRQDLDWKFLGLGVNVDSGFKNFGFEVVPASYKLFSPLLESVFVGPVVGIGTKGYELGLSLGVGL